MYDRWLTRKVEEYLHFMRVVYIRGARQSGKTTLVKGLSSSEDIYRTLDTVTQFEAAYADPRFFVRHSSRRLIIDEIQKVPQLIPAIKQEVDEDPTFGRYLLTGSSDVFSHPSVTESLAGRIGSLHLCTLTVGEEKGFQPRFLDYCTKAWFPGILPECSKELVIEYGLRGGYPEIIDFQKEYRNQWLQQYLQTLLTRDLVHISNIARHDAVLALVRTLASYSSKAINGSQISSALGISRPTFYSYCGYLEQLFLFERVAGWASTDYSKVGKTDTWFASDSGLMAAILQWDIEKVLNDPDACGKLVETFVFHELSAHLSLQQNYTLFRYRDHGKREIDFLLEKSDQFVGIEVKAGETVRTDDFRHLVWFRENLAKKSFLGLVLYGGNEVLSFGTGLWALPISVLWG